MNGKPVFTVPAKTILNFTSGFAKKLLCDYYQPLHAQSSKGCVGGITFTAGTACAYSCSFCYVGPAMRKQESWLKEHGVEGKHEDVVIRRENPVEILRRQLKNAKRKDEPLVIYASPLVDVAANMELVLETVELCQVILEETQWHIRLLSKSNLLPKIAQALEGSAGSAGSAPVPGANETVPVEQSPSRICSGGTPSVATGTVALPVSIARQRIIYGVSTGTLDDKLAQAFEQGCPLVSKRIQSLHWLQNNGFRTFGMICPSLPQWGPEDRRWEMEVRQSGFPEDGVVPSYAKFAQDMAAAIRAERCEHVWAEVINVRGESFIRTEAALNNAGYGAMADELHRVSVDKAEWEQYSRATFLGHASVPANEGKLRFLQYVNNDNRDFWQAQEARGAVLL